MMRGLLIRSPHIEKILSGQKSWEIRGSKTKVRGQIALIRSGSGLVVGACELVDVVGHLTLRQLKKNARKLGLSSLDGLKRLPYRKTYAWVLRKARRFKSPKPYKHPSGAVIWVKLKIKL